MNWIKFSDRTPDAKKYKVLVFCTSCIYSQDDEETVEVLHWYKND